MSEFKCPLCKSVTPKPPKQIFNAEVLRQALKKIESRDYFIIYYRIVLGTTLEEVGKILGYTRERILQLEKKALRKISRWFSLTLNTTVTIDQIINMMREDRHKWPFPPKEWLRDNNLFWQKDITKAEEKLIEEDDILEDNQ